MYTLIEVITHLDVISRLSVSKNVNDIQYLSLFPSLVRVKCPLMSPAPRI